MTPAPPQAQSQGAPVGPVPQGLLVRHYAKAPATARQWPFTQGSRAVKTRHQPHLLNYNRSENKGFPQPSTRIYSDQQ